MSDGQPRQIILNEIQRSMLRWNSVHPYNVVDLVEVLRPLKGEQLRAAAKIVLGDMGLGIPRPDRTERRAGFEQSPVGIEVFSRSLGTQTKPALEEFSTNELNRPFVIGRDAALRLTLLEAGSSLYVAMTYQHWVMDGTAAARVFRRILAEAFGIPRERGNTTELDTPLCDKVFAHRRRGIAGLVQKLEGLRGLVTRTRAAAPWQCESQETRVNVRVLATSEGSLDRLRSMARHHGCTVNDALLAGIFRAIDRAMPRRRRNFWRRNIAVCNIADLRPFAAELQDNSGVYVGFFGTHMGGLPQDSARLLELIRRQTSRAKKFGISLGSLAAFRALPRLWKLLPSGKRVVFLRTLFRYSSGLSNLRLDTHWEDPSWAGLVRDYTRCCPLGIMLPLILGVTTRGDEFTMTMTSARGGYRQEQLDAIAGSIEAFLAGAFRSGPGSV